ncbi:hypothetical protein F4808DRAFT_474095 [Astrocystis sublimbata]|nr:hypothetical protein F4808DRAFT_474095 [Astrocystis sublimbata]
MNRESDVKFAKWYATVHPRSVDIVGDFGGKQLFLIDGDSLLLHSVTTSRVDYEVGFQLLHAIFAVELFQIVFFDNQKKLCIPSTTPQCISYKYEMTRTILIQHLRRSVSHSGGEDDTALAFSFPSVDSEQFHEHLAQNPAAFLLCHDGHIGSERCTPNLSGFHYMIHQFLRFRHSVGLIQGTEFRSSRVMVPMIMAAPMIEFLAAPQGLYPAASAHSPESLKLDWAVYQGTSHRELLIAVALNRVLQTERGEQHKIMAIAMLLHSTVISHTHLSERAWQAQDGGTNEYGKQFMGNLCREIANIVDLDLRVFLARDLYWDLFDIIDGRLFLSLHAALSMGQSIPAMLVDEAKPMIACVEQWSGVPLLDHSCLRIFAEWEVDHPDIRMTTSHDLAQAGILSFNHELLNKFLEPVQLQTTHIQEEASESKVFRDLTHWHNAKRSLEAKKVSKRPGFFARKRNQEFMADTLKYSESLTSSGNLIKPQTITMKKNSAPLKKPVNNHAVSRTIKGKKKAGNASGKDRAHETVAMVDSQKLKERDNATIRHWHTIANELDQEKALDKRFRKANRYFLSLSKEDKRVIGAEVSFYVCDTLHRAWEERAGKTSSQQALGIGSLLFMQVMETITLPGWTPEIAAALQVVSSLVGIEGKLLPNPELVSRQLGFHPRVSEAGRPALMDMEFHDFHLGSCGPFLERSFDSVKDDRVPFEPDAWQRSVLDSIDAYDSLFIVAPTSSGKTFISFYAMEKVLRADNDSVLVYVAPTKALVNQIAAEIQARFKKSYAHEGRSVWAIHTRDYRVNNPTGCQILVTVPHVLQIMLLSPSNANSWSKRVKRIIFDEVHCIGQADDGIIWEQLLLMAPCPIIALSATVGNPEEFHVWLRNSQTSKGFKFEMITHSSRYSDLRAFQYIPSESFDFKGLQCNEDFLVPGLGGPTQAGSKTGVDIQELSLEPRDALSLWTSMDKFQTESFPLDKRLHPSRTFSGVPKKSDVLAWTQRLKTVLAAWMHNSASPFDHVCRTLEPDTPERDVIHQSYSAPGQAPQQNERLTTFALLTDLHKENGLPAILFNYDRFECENTVELVLEHLESQEEVWKKSDKGWQKDIRNYDIWKASEHNLLSKRNEEKLTKQERAREDANAEVSRWESFDPTKPLKQFSFSDSSRLTLSELRDFIDSLGGENFKPYLFSALKRGIAVHHAGMNRKYRQVVEILFRKGFLTVVIATGTLALGINMPCKTVAFIGDSAYLTTLNYRQGAGRAGRRGFDLLGNVVFANVSRTRAYELMSSRLPDLKGHFPLTTTLVLRILGLVDAAGQSSLVSGIVESLLTQNRLYLGGEEAGKSIQHHLRFSVEYLQRQHLLSADGKPINFAGLVGHLYFTENAVFAFHSLLKSGYFHRLCSNIHQNRSDTLRTMGLVMAHLFNRIRTPGDSTDSNPYALPRLPREAEDLLIRHNNETLNIFKTYSSTFIDQYLHGPPDRYLPFTGIAAGGEQAWQLRLPGAAPAPKLRSPFSALSGLSDDFKSIGELCSDIRSGVFLEESAVPYIPIWPHDIATPFNSYIFDFLKDGDYAALTRDNKIKPGDVWFLLRDFSLVLATIVTSLANFMRAESNGDDDLAGLEDPEEMRDTEAVSQAVRTTIRDAKLDVPRPKTAKKKIVDSWEDEEDDDDGSNTEEGAVDGLADKPPTKMPEPSVWEGDERGLADVLDAFTLLKQDFDDKFHKVWA